MALIEFKDLPDTSTPINATNLNNNFNEITNIIYPVGAIYTSSNDTNPSSLFGGTWKQIRTFSGGELVAFGTITNGSSNANIISKDNLCPFSDGRIPNKVYDITNYVDGILESDSGTIKVYPKGIVGLIEANVCISGNGASGLKGLWWQENSNELPTGVSMLGGSLALLTATDASYGGNSNTYFYKITDEATDETEFYINPQFKPYNGDFTPASSGTKCHLLVKAYAKRGTTYMWERTA